MSQGEEKTEEPSSTKLLDARKKGQVAKSTDVVVLGSLAMTFLAISFCGPAAIKKFAFFLQDVYGNWLFAKDPPPTLALTRQGFDLWLFFSVPILASAALGSIGASLGQFGFLFSTHPLKFDIKKINPVDGVKKLFSKNRLVDFLKQLAKFSGVLFIIYQSIKEVLSEVVLTVRGEISYIVVLILEMSSKIIARVLCLFLFIALFDYFWSKYSFLKSMRMSKYEVKKEYKQQEGDPAQKSERRRLHQEALEEGAKLDQASVLITNPSHLAVALQFDSLTDEAPKVVLKASGERAKDLIKEAHWRKIPIIRNVPLAWDLMWVEINQEIPAELYEAVAEIIAFLQKLDQEHEEAKT
jgi:flagellar biosynthesis protein FlhB